MQSLYPVEKAIRLGGPLGIGGQGQELRYVSGLYMPAHGVLADAIFPRYAAICALPSRQQLLDSKALLVRANGTDPTQLLLLIHATTPPLLFCELGLSLCETVCQYLGTKLEGLRLPLRLWLGLLRSARQGFSFGVQGSPELVFASLAHFYLHFPTVQSWAMRLFAWPAVFDEPP